MNKKLYVLLIFFSILFIFTILLESIIRFQLGPQMFMLPFFSTWFLVVNLISLTGAVLLWKYYRRQEYRFIYITSIISTVCNLVYAVVSYLGLAYRVLVNYNVPFLFLSLGAGIVYAVSLISLKADKKWLRMAGFFMFLIMLIFLSTLLWLLSAQSVQNSNRFEQIIEWLSLASCFVPLMFAVHFFTELKHSPTSSADFSKQKGFSNALGLMGIAGIVTLTLGFILIDECHSSKHWARENFLKTQKLFALTELKTFSNSKGETLLYQLLKPLDYDATKKYPLLISLPYGGQPGTDTTRQIEGSAAAEIFSDSNYRRKYPAFIFIPHCPPGSGWGGVPNVPSVDSLVLDAIASLDQQYSIDAKRRYVTGISRGGYGTWNFICKRPDMFAAAIPVCGGGDPAQASKAAHVAVWAFHGKHDKNVPVSGSRDMIAAIEKAGGHPKYTEFPDEGHNIWYQVSMTPGLWDWLFTQKRD